MPQNILCDAERRPVGQLCQSENRGRNARRPLTCTSRQKHRLRLLCFDLTCNIIAHSWNLQIGLCCPPYSFFSVLSLGVTECKKLKESKKIYIYSFWLPLPGNHGHLLVPEILRMKDLKSDGFSRSAGGPFHLGKNWGSFDSVEFRVEDYSVEAPATR